jgi:hypothetical protein
MSGERTRITIVATRGGDNVLLDQQAFDAIDTVLDEVDAGTGRHRYLHCTSPHGAAVRIDTLEVAILSSGALVRAPGEDEAEVVHD